MILAKHTVCYYYGSGIINYTDMRTIKLTAIVTMTEDHYNNGMAELKNEILSGKFQREMVEQDKGKVLKVKATFQEL